MSAPYRGSRCGVCYWALYDGDYCQNPKCENYGRSVNDNRVHLNNDEALTLIRKREIDQTPQGDMSETHG